MLDLKGIGSEGAILNLLISAFIIYHIYIKPKMMKKNGKDRRKPMTNPHPAPGNATECKDNFKAITEAGTEIKNIKEKIKEEGKKNREDHQLIFKKIDQVKNSRR